MYSVFICNCLLSLKTRIKRYLYTHRLLKTMTYFEDKELKLLWPIGPSL